MYTGHSYYRYLSIQYSNSLVTLTVVGQTIPTEKYCAAGYIHVLSMSMYFV